MYTSLLVSPSSQVRCLFHGVAVGRYIYQIYPTQIPKRLVNINLENGARRDRVGRATVARAMGGGHAAGPWARGHLYTSHMSIHCRGGLHGAYATGGGSGRENGQELIG